MKFKEIKPGMVIHCPKEEDARALLEYLNELGYVWGSLAKINPDEYIGDTFGNKDGWYYYIKTDIMKKISSANIKNVILKTSYRDGITEFSDLIEPDEEIEQLKNIIQNNPLGDVMPEHEMSAVEVLEWLEKNGDDTDVLQEAFGEGCMNYDDVFGLYSARQVFDYITAYEAAKKEPNPVELEWVTMCRIIQIKDNDTKKCVYEEDVSNTPTDNDLKGICEDILKEYSAKHDGRYIAVIEEVCRVKGE